MGIISAERPTGDVRLAQYDVVYVPRTGIYETWTYWNQFLQQFESPGQLGHLVQRQSERGALGMPYGFLATLFKHRGAALAMLLAWLLAGTGYVLFKTPEYESTAELVVRFGDRSIPDVNRSPVTEMTMTPSDRREIVLAHAAMLSSHYLAERTVRSIGLARLYPDIASDPPSRWSAMDEAVRVFSKKLSVDVGTQDNIITVSFLHPDKMLATQVVKNLIDLYIAGESAVYQNPQQPFLRNEVKQSGDRLAAAQAALEKFKDQWRITDYDQEAADLLKQRGDVDINLRERPGQSGTCAESRPGSRPARCAEVPANQAGASFRGKCTARWMMPRPNSAPCASAGRSQMLATYARRASPAESGDIRCLHCCGAGAGNGARG